MPVETGRNKPPGLMKDNRGGTQDTADQGKLQIKKNPSW